MCKAPGDDILIFVNFRLEATARQSPVVKGKNKRHTCTPAIAHIHTPTANAQQKCDFNKLHLFVFFCFAKAELLAGELHCFFSLPPAALWSFFSLKQRGSGDDKEARRLHRLSESRVN